MSKSGSSTSTVPAKDQRYVRDDFMQSRLHFYVRRFASGASTCGDADRLVWRKAVKVMCFRVIGTQGHLASSNIIPIPTPSFFFFTVITFQVHGRFPSPTSRVTNNFSGDFRADACRYFSSRQSEVSTVVVVAQIIDSQAFPPLNAIQVVVNAFGFP